MNMKIIVLIAVAVAIVAIVLYLGRRRDREPDSIRPPTNADEFNALFDGAATRLKPLVATGGYAPGHPNSTQARRLRSCIRELEACLAFVPDHWQSMVFLAKAYQALGEHRTSLDWLSKAMEVEPENHVLPKEASIEAIHLRDVNLALRFSAEALRRKPGDPDLMGNHAMNLLLAGRDEEATQTIREALELVPDDSFNQRISQIISDVASGKRDRPTCESVMP